MLPLFPPRPQEVVASHPPRLFQCSNASGRFTVEEIFDFSQEVQWAVVLCPQHTGKPAYL